MAMDNPHRNRTSNKVDNMNNAERTKRENSEHLNYTL